jgi:hypothetical protein
MGGQVTWDQCLREFTAEEKLTNLNSLSYYVHMFWRSSLNLNPSLNSLSYYVHMFPRDGGSRRTWHWTSACASLPQRRSSQGLTLTTALSVKHIKPPSNSWKFSGASYPPPPPLFFFKAATVTTALRVKHIKTPSNSWNFSGAFFFPSFLILLLSKCSAKHTRTPSNLWKNSQSVHLHTCIRVISYVNNNFLGK